MTMARAAPKLAAAEMPRVKGLASGLARMVCICAPAAESAAPTTIAMTATGMRISQTTTRIWSGAEAGLRMAATTSRMSYLAGPQAISTAKLTTSATVSPARIRMRL